MALDPAVLKARIDLRVCQACGKAVRFTVREPRGPNVYRYAWDRAVKIAGIKGWTEVKFA